MASRRGRAGREHTRVVIDARIPEGAWGGVQQVVQGLAFGFCRLDDNAELLFLTKEPDPSWLSPYLAGRYAMVPAPPTLGMSRRRRMYERAKRLSRGGAALLQRAAPLLAGRSVAIARSDGFVESLEPDVVHFTTQQAFLTAVPTIYQPHDLQHLHLPELFSPLQRRHRELTYRTYSQQANVVAVMTEWGRRDLITAFGIPAERVAVVPWAPVAGLRTVRDVRALPRSLPSAFVLFPAQTWPHKNHLRLVEAIARLRDRGLRVHLVAIGRLNEHFESIRHQVEQLRLSDQVFFLGYVDDETVDALYRRATALVYPSLFEGWGLPVVEAFAYGVPVAASNATVLPEVSAGAALLFDPQRVDSIADAIARIWTDEELRRDLIARGRRRADELSWEKTAATFLALYRKVAGQRLSDADRALLAPPTLVASG